MQGVDDIDKDIEAASLKALAAHSRLNSTLASVYARSSAPQEAAAEAVPAAETAAVMAGVQTLPLPVPAESAPRVAAQKEEESLLNRVTLRDILQGVSHHASASQLDHI